MKGRFLFFLVASIVSEHLVNRRVVTEYTIGAAE